MFHKIKNVSALPDFRLSVQFSEGVTKIYDVKPLFEKNRQTMGCFRRGNAERIRKCRSMIKGAVKTRFLQPLLCVCGVGVIYDISFRVEW